MNEHNEQPSGSPESGPRPPVDPSFVPPPPPPPNQAYGNAPPPGYGYPPPQQQSVKKGMGGLISKVFSSLVVGLLMTSIVLNIYFGMFYYSHILAGPMERPYLEGDEMNRIVVLPVVGMVDDDAAEYVRQALGNIAEDPPKAVVLRIDSGGGTVSASDLIWHYLESFKEEHPEVVIVASFGSLAASGGYYIAVPASHIVAEPTCITGSIGVMAPVLTFGGLMEKIGVTPETIVATESPEKDVANDIFRPWTEEDREVVRHLLDHSYNRFVGIVAQGRAHVLSEEQVLELAKGQIFTASEAVEAKLVDDIGYIEDAIDQAADLAGIPDTIDPYVTMVNRPRPFSPMFMLGSKSVEFNVPTPQQVQSWMYEIGTPRPAYRIWIE